MNMNRHRLFLRGTTNYREDAVTGKQVSLRTRDQAAAERILHAHNDRSSSGLATEYSPGDVARCLMLIGCIFCVSLDAEIDRSCNHPAQFHHAIRIFEFKIPHPHEV